MEGGAAWSCYDVVGFSVPYVGHPEEERAVWRRTIIRKKRMFITLTKLCSIRSRSRGASASAPLRSLARKLGRFKVRIIVLSDDTLRK
ncbi:uncharacterized protein G2W53_024208 [Senna tora]|uniref:Uncharacterized protein n=1 Tax=Senna tora TaxID=362788 RepID=A0A834TAV6_9FABA|nr:uncharacterized protein G2W53_024208 [Senna tora]